MEGTKRNKHVGGGLGLEVKRIDARHFKEIFDCSMTDVALKIGRTRESVSMIFRGRPASDKLLEMVAEALTEIADENYKREIEIAKYKRAKAEKIIKFCYGRMKGERYGRL